MGWARKHIWLFVLLLSLCAAVLVYMYTQYRFHDEAQVLRVSGNIEVTDVEVSFKIAGRVEKRLVSEGETIAQGDLVAILDSADLVNEMAIRRAELWVAQAMLAELEAGYRPEEIAEAQAAMQKAEAFLMELRTGARRQETATAAAAVARARADATRLERDLQRADGLHRKGLLSTQDSEATRAAYDMAVARLHETEEQLKLVKEGPRREQIEQARAALAQTQARLKLMLEGPRKEQIEQARARVAQVKEALNMAEVHLGYTRLLSPLAGVVLSKNVEPGEYVAPGTPVVTVGDLAQVWLRAYINETDLGRVRIGQRVHVTTDTYPGRVYAGQISFLASQAEFTPKNVQTARERVKLVYRIKADILNPNIELKPGMPADAVIMLEPPGRGV